MLLVPKNMTLMWYEIIQWVLHNTACQISAFYGSSNHRKLQWRLAQWLSRLPMWPQYRQASCIFVLKGGILGAGDGQLYAKHVGTELRSCYNVLGGVQMFHKGGIKQSLKEFWTVCIMVLVELRLKKHLQWEQTLPPAMLVHVPARWQQPCQPIAAQQQRS